jgi:hypothetical protein
MIKTGWVIARQDGFYGTFGISADQQKPDHANASKLLTQKGEPGSRFGLFGPSAQHPPCW